MSAQTSIFLSHSSTDKALATELAQQIERQFAGLVHVFVSSRPDAIPSGTAWLETVLNNLDHAEMLVILLTKQAENSVWVGFELGYFWKKTNKRNIHTLYQPNVAIPSPLDILQGKLVTDGAQVQAFLAELCNQFGVPFDLRCDIEAITKKATITVISHISELDQQLAWRMRDALTAMRFPLHLYCQKASAEDHYYHVLRTILDSSPPDVNGPPGRPDGTVLEPVINVLQNRLLLEPCEGIHAPPGKRWIDWILMGFVDCIQRCQVILNRHSNTADQRLIGGLERLSHSIAQYQDILNTILQNNIADLIGAVGASYFELALQEMLHGERVWKTVLGAEVTE